MFSKTKEDYSWSRPNRRYFPEYYLPSQYSENLDNITIAIDTSGSITEEDLNKIISEISYIQDVLQPNSMTIFDCDVKIHNIHNVKQGDIISDLTFNGGGGSNTNPVFEYLKDKPTTVLIYLTDLYVILPEEFPTFPVLWIVYDNPEATVPFGDIIHYELN